MPLQTFIGKVRQLDNQIAKWMMGHFYILFFQIFLVFIFFLVFVNIIKLIDVSQMVTEGNTFERLLLLQTSNSNIIVVLMLLNSFWMLFVFNGIVRIRSILRDIDFHLSRNKSGKD